MIAHVRNGIGQILKLNLVAGRLVDATVQTFIFSDRWISPASNRRGVQMAGAFCREPAGLHRAWPLATENVEKFQPPGARLKIRAPQGG